MDPEEFSVYLFSNSSLDTYADNSLTRFTVDLKTPLYLGENTKYSVALSEINIPASFSNARAERSRDCIVFNQFDYVVLFNGVASFANFIEATLRICSTDISLYDETYFRDYLNKSIMFHPFTFPPTFRNDHTEISDPQIFLEIPLELSLLLKTNETIDDFLPPAPKFKKTLSSNFEKCAVHFGFRQG